MLTRLHIENIALIDTLELQFDQGFNVFTGETGAGKSIIIDSVNLVLGERADREMIKSGCDKALVEALFNFEDPNLIKAINELEIDCDGELILSRELNISGKNSCKINGRLANVTTVKKISDMLVDIHGQHEHQSLLRLDIQKKYIDESGGRELSELRKKYSVLFDEWRRHKLLIEKNNATPQDLDRRLDILQFQQEEIFAANLYVGEDNHLTNQRDLLQNAKKINSALNESYDCLYSKEPSAYSLLRSALAQIEQISDFSEQYENIKNRLSDVFFGMEDVCIEIRSIKDTEYDPYKLEEIDERLELIKKLKRKYGNSIEEILNYLEGVRSELSKIDEYKLQAANALAKKRELEDQLYNVGLMLSKKRKEAAKRFGALLIDQLKDLGLEKSTFEVVFEELPDLTPDFEFMHDGLDSIEMMISTNPGEPPRPLNKVASGGEISRIMLAFKAIAANSDNISIVIFDEIDTGISGKTAAVVGEKMLNISNSHQVICVTHSPQIAAIANAHYLIEKTEIDGKYRTKSHCLTFDERILEIARILGDDNIGTTAQEHAKILLSKSFEKNKCL